ncbi:anti-sigma factor [Kribbella sp. HUAS MG21]|uniref:Anti-sigma factor n=1 Tax=Kribbella sp. HUAS MG21 TaxID=3160966 RepID=A0AAU7TGS1_9ACTN
MTKHLDEELLAQWALDGESPDAAAAEHLQSCATCRTTLAELRSLVGVTHDLPRLEAPGAHVWQRITDELGPEYAAQETTDDGHRAAGNGTQDTRRRFRSSALALAACVAVVLGAGAGILGTLYLTDDEPDQPVADVMIRLEPLAGKTGDGSADLIRASTGTQLKVDATGLGTTTAGYYEVWLINADGQRMVSLGVLNPLTGSTFQVPAGLTSQGYRIVDVSLEPEDGNPEHSRDSVIRGTLPS